MTYKVEVVANYRVTVEAEDEWQARREAERAVSASEFSPLTVDAGTVQKHVE